jgi:RNA polymerase sigma-70 factor (ECF subfamily)
MWPEPAELQELLANARRGDGAAEERLLELIREPLRRQIAHRLNPAIKRREDASDVVQLALVEIHQRLLEFLQKPTMSFQLWVQLIARDHINDAHRRNVGAQKRTLNREQPMIPAAQADHSSAEWAAQFLDPELTPASEAIRREQEAMIAAAIECLDEDDRQIILMRHRDKCSNQKVAQTLGLNEAAASMRHLRAVRRLTTLLKPD